MIQLLDHCLNSLCLQVNLAGSALIIYLGDHHHVHLQYLL